MSKKIKIILCRLTFISALILSGINIPLYAQDNNVPYDIVKQMAELAKANELSKLPPVITTNPPTDKKASPNSVDSVIMMLEGLKQNTRKTTLTYEEYMKIKQSVWGKTANSKVKFYESK